MPHLTRLRHTLASLLLLSSLGAILGATAGVSRAQTGTSYTPDLPVIDTPTVDRANVLSPDAEARISARLVELREKSGVQMAVLTVKTTNDVPIEEFASSTFARWGGGQKTRNDGVLFVLAVDDRRNRIEVGYGIEPILTDAASMTILESIKPSLRAADYDTATLDLVNAVFDKVSHLEPDSAVTLPTIPFGARGGFVFVTIILAWLFGVAYRLFAPKNRSDTGSEFWRKAMAKLPVIDLKIRNIAVWAALPALLGLITAITTGLLFGLAYVLTWYIMAAVGLFAGEVYVKGPIRSAFFTAIIGTITVLALVNVGDEPVPDAFTIGSAVFAFAAIFCFVNVFFVASSSGGGGGGGGGGYRSGSSSSSSSRSSWSSSSSSRSSSSSSSSSWSGGGGRSGGGGASSSW